MAAATSRLAVACILEKWYSFQTEATLQASGFEDCMDELQFITDKPVLRDSSEVVASALPAADRAWAGQHVSVWQQCAAAASPMLIFDENCAFTSSNTFAEVSALVAVCEAGPVANTDAMVMILDRALPDDNDSAIVLSGAHGVTLRAVQSAPAITAYVLWPAAAKALLQMLPLDLPVSDCLSKHVAERTLIALMPSSPLTASSQPLDER